MRTRLTSLTLVATLLMVVVQLLWAHQARRRREHAAYHPYRLHGVPTPAEGRQRAAQAAQAGLSRVERAVQLPAAGRATVVYSDRLTARPSLAATVTAIWAAAA